MRHPPLLIKFHRPSPIILAAMLTAGALSPTLCTSQESVSLTPQQEQGRAIYEKTCASCHGDHGQGVEEQFAEALVGDDTIGELSRVITETMPEENPDECVGEDAEAVAAYIHYAFYSEAARLRNRPPTKASANCSSTPCP